MYGPLTKYSKSEMGHYWWTDEKVKMRHLMEDGGIIINRFIID